MTIAHPDMSVTIFRQTWTTRDDLRANRDCVFVYGDNVAREGHRGLARQMRGEPNAHPISISWGPFEPFTHATAAKAKAQIEQDLDALLALKSSLIVWPLIGIVPDFQSMPDEIHHYLQVQAQHRFGLTDPA
ncbi:MAG: hypothetical protein ACE37M_13060 [Henriciella sp.]